MNVRLLPSSPAHPDSLQYLTGFLIDDAVAIDAGSLGLFDTPERQARITHILLTHAHLDHVATLPVFLENRFRSGGEPPVVCGPAESLEALRAHVFNDRLWPDYFRIEKDEGPFVRFRAVDPGAPFTAGDLRCTAVPVTHSVPAFGYLVEGDGVAAVFGGDSGPTEAIWRRAGEAESLAGVFLECSFPNALHDLALLVGHLTPELLAEEAAKLPPATPVHVVHIKAAHRETVLRELEALAIPHCVVARPDRDVSF